MSGAKLRSSRLTFNTELRISILFIYPVFDSSLKCDKKLNILFSLSSWILIVFFQNLIDYFFRIESVPAQIVSVDQHPNSLPPKKEKFWPSSNQPLCHVVLFSSMKSKSSARGKSMLLNSIFTTMVYLHIYVLYNNLFQLVWNSIAIRLLVKKNVIFRNWMANFRRIVFQTCQKLSNLFHFGVYLVYQRKSLVPFRTFYVSTCSNLITITKVGHLIRIFSRNCITMKYMKN